MQLTDELASIFNEAKLDFANGRYDDARLKVEGIRAIVPLRSQRLVFGPTDHRRPSSSVVVLSHQGLEVFSLLSFLAEVLDFSRHELIVVDNGNPKLLDEASRILENWTYLTPGFNVGCSWGRNLAATIASGESLIFLDDDGVIESDSIDVLERSILTFRAAAVRGRVFAKGAQGIAARHFDLGPHCMPSLPNTEGISIWNTSLFNAFGGFDELLVGYEGVELCWRMLRFCGPEKFLYSPDAILHHDFAENATSARRKAQKQRMNLDYLSHLGLSVPKLRSQFKCYEETNRSLIFNSIVPSGLVESIDDVNPHNAPRLSILTTVRDGKDWLLEYKRSLDLQTIQDFEVILIDDGSSDGTAELVRDMFSKDERFVLVNTEPKGRSSALNLALNLASCDICLIADVDDVSVFDRFEITLSYFLMNPQSDCVSFLYFSDDPARGVSQPLVPGRQRLRTRILFGMPAAFPCFAFRKAKFREGFDETLRQGVDCEFLFRNMLAHQLDGELIPVVSTYYRIHDSQISMRRGKQMTVAFDCVVAAHKHFLPDLRDDDVPTVARLGGFVRGRSVRAGEELNNYCGRLLQSLAIKEPSLLDDAAKMLDFRLRQLGFGGKQLVTLPHRVSRKVWHIIRIVLKTGPSGWAR